MISIPAQLQAEAIERAKAKIDALDKILSDLEKPFAPRLKRGETITWTKPELAK